MYDVENSRSPGDDGDEIAQATTANGKRPAKKSDTTQRTKRMRVSRACDQCRAGREKCDGAQPSCQTCDSQARLCSYNEQPKKRGIQPNYIRTLELTLAWIFQTSPDCENTLSRLLPDTEAPAHRLINWKDVSSAEALHTAWRSNIICRQIDQMLSGADVEVPRSSPAPPVRHAPLEHSRARRSTMPYQSPPLSAPSDRENAHQDPTDSTSGNSLIDSSHIVALTRSVGGTERLHLPANAWGLLEHFFAFTQTWLPIIERHDVLKLMYTYPSGGLLRHDATASGHAELWSIMAFASLQLNAPGSSQDFELCSETANSLIPHEQGFQLGHIKALLILCLTEIAREAWLKAWLLAGSAVRLLTHFNFGKGTSTTLFEGRTKHTMLAAFLLESMIASKTAAITHLRADDVRNVGLLIEDGLEEWSPWESTGTDSTAGRAPARSISTFNDLVRIAIQSVAEKPALSPISQSDSSAINVAFCLIQNSGTNGSRRHPAAILAEQKNARTPTQPVQRESIHSPAGPPTVRVPGPPRMELSNVFFDQQYPFMSIPNETTESIANSTPANPFQSGVTPGTWTGADPQIAGDLDNYDLVDAIPVNTTSGVDIFEELAMLDRNESTQNPKFMQNLGFGPDLDLAEFFGEDYQPSDPLLSYMQPSALGDLPRNYFNGSNKDAG